jgi:O-antigen ligase
MEFYTKYKSHVLPLVALLLASGLFSHILSTRYTELDGQKSISVMAMSLLGVSYVFSFFLLATHFKEAKARLNYMVYGWGALILWAGVTVFLNEPDLLTLSRLLGLVGCGLVGLMLFVCSDTTDTVLKYFLVVCSVIVVFNIVYIEPSVLFDASSRNIRGVHVQKNTLGQLTYLTLFIGAAVFSKVSKTVRVGVILLFITAAWLLMLSTSMTSNILIPTAVATLFLLAIIQTFRHGWIAALVICLVFLLGLIYFWNDLFELMGKSTSFTGRTNIWNAYIHLIEQQPLLGYGYGSAPANPANSHWLTIGAHSGYLELTFQTGMIGLLLFLLILMYTFKSIWHLRLFIEERFSFYVLATFVVVFLTVNLTETYTLQRSGLYWIFFIYSTLRLSHLAQKVRLRH